MTPTEKLRAMLDERGVEHYDHEDGEPLRKLEQAADYATSWRMGDVSICAVPIEGSDLFDLWIDHITPEQAIAATVGDTCQSVLDPTYYKGIHGYCQSLKCSKCGEPLFKEFRFCPWCGSKVVGA